MVGLRWSKIMKFPQYAEGEFERINYVFLKKRRSFTQRLYFGVSPAGTYLLMLNESCNRFGKKRDSSPGH
jgi:hypothetical protein